MWHAVHVYYYHFFQAVWLLPPSDSAIMSVITFSLLSNNSPNPSDSAAFSPSVRQTVRANVPVVALTVISHLHQQQCCRFLCWNPSLVFQCALIADWPDWDRRHQSCFLSPVTSCPVSPSLSHPVSQALRVSLRVRWRSGPTSHYSGLVSSSLTSKFALLFCEF